MTHAVLTSTDDHRLADLVEELSQKLAAGNSGDIDAFLAEHPDNAEKLRPLIPTLQMLVEMGSSPVANGRSRANLAEDHEHPTGGRPVLGDFRILREVGRGGMGVVYEAEQVSLRRRVALKVLPTAAMLDPRALQRFRNEAQAAAALHHSQIVPIYGVGCERGVHYYAMQFIDGLTLAEVIANLRQSAGLPPLYQPEAPARENVGWPSQAVQNNIATAGDPAPKTDGLRSPSYKEAPSATETDVLAALSTEKSGKRSAAWYRRIAEQFAQVADALHHAHELGVTHRDIKPANLMLDRLGNIWITDFGLARIEGEGNLTMTGDLVGTLRYMSPEQSLAKRIGIDHRTDIYSLGITLYEILTLHPALSGQGRQELLRQIAFEEPKALRKLNSAIPMDLETIVLKMIEKNPAERYPTAAELTADLKRFVDDRSVAARRPNLCSRAVKWSRRNVASLLATLCVVTSFAISSSIGSFLILQARNDAVSKSNELKRRHEKTVVLLGRVNGTVDLMLEHLSSLPTGDKTRQAIMEDELNFYNELKDFELDYPEASDQLALAHHRIGHLQIDLKQYDQAQESLLKAIAIFERRSREEPNALSHINSLCHAWMNLGRCQVLRYNRPAAIESFRRSIKYGEQTTLKSPDNTGYRMALAFPWGQLGILDARMGRAADAKAAHEREIELHRQNVVSRPEDFGYRLVFGMAMFIYSESLDLLGESQLASENLESAITVYDSLHDQRPEDWLTNTRLKLFRDARDHSIALNAQFTDLINGGNPTLTASRRAELARYALINRNYPGIAINWFAQAFLDDPSILENAEQHRYNAACAALLTMLGKGKDAKSLKEAEQARLGHQALAWLRDDLADWKRRTETAEPTQLPLVLQTLVHWQEDPDLASLRDENQIQQLPIKDQEACRKLWNDHTELVERIRRTISAADK